MPFDSEKHFREAPVSDISFVLYAMTFHLELRREADLEAEVSSKGPR